MDAQHVYHYDVHGACVCDYRRHVYGPMVHACASMLFHNGSQRLASARIDTRHAPALTISKSGPPARACHCSHNPCVSFCSTFGPCVNVMEVTTAVVPTEPSMRRVMIETYLFAVVVAPPLAMTGAPRSCRRVRWHESACPPALVPLS